MQINVKLISLDEFALSLRYKSYRHLFFIPCTCMNVYNADVYACNKLKLWVLFSLLSQKRRNHAVNVPRRASVNGF